jgi:hypothetical protein
VKKNLKATPQLKTGITNQTVSKFNMMQQKSRTIESNATSANRASTNTATNTQNNSVINAPRIYTQKEANKEKKFASQFMLMCLSIIISSSILSVFQLRSVIYNFSNIFYYIRFILRGIVLLAVSLVPAIATFYHPSRDKFFSRLKAKINPVN